MRWLSDEAVAHLRNVTELPDLTGTRYRLVGEIARGGMGVVYEADDLELERRVALKVLASELTSADAVERMRREARTIARLEHPGIVPVHDVGLLPDGRIYYAMKLVRGTRLDTWVREQHSLTEILRAFVRVCEAVAFAHANGVVHRDLKPENVMAGELGAVLVMDWGVATNIGEDDGTRAGTPGYMAPENEIDARTDVFSLGRILQFLAPNAPRRLGAIAEKATALDRNTRYADARELAEDVLRFLDAEPVSAYRENIFEVAWRWMIRYRALIAIVTAYLVMRAIVLLVARR